VGAGWLQALPTSVTSTANLPVLLLPASKETYKALAATIPHQTQQQQESEQQHHHSHQPDQQRLWEQQQEHHAPLQGQAGGSAREQPRHASLPARHQPAVLLQPGASEGPSFPAGGSGHGHAVSGGSSLGSFGSPDSFDTTHSTYLGSHTSDAASASTGTTSISSAIALTPEAAAASIHVFPEGGMTDGRSGLMRFSRGFMRFAAGLPVVPVALRVRTCLPEVASHTLTSSFGANLFWWR